MKDKSIKAVTQFAAGYLPFAIETHVKGDTVNVNMSEYERSSNIFPLQLKGFLSISKQVVVIRCSLLRLMLQNFDYYLKTSSISTSVGNNQQQIQYQFPTSCNLLSPSLSLDVLPPSSTYLCGVKRNNFESESNSQSV